MRHEAVLAVTKVFALYKGTDHAVWMPLIRAAAPAQLHGLSTDALNHLIKQSAGETLRLYYKCKVILAAAVCIQSGRRCHNLTP